MDPGACLIEDPSIRSCAGSPGPSPSLCGTSASASMLSYSAKPARILFLEAIRDQETRGGANYLEMQSDIYNQIFKIIFGIKYNSKPRTRPPTNRRLTDVPLDTHSYKYNKSEYIYIL